MNTDKKIIDIIIPVYKARETLPRTLASIMSQVEIDKAIVTLVNDADELDYSDIIATFSPYMEIHEYKLKKNAGPGVARQFGIDMTCLPYITFIDADDTLASPFSLRVLLREVIKNPKIAVVLGNFGEETINNDETPMDHHINDFVWMFGKLYRRSFLDKYSVRFNDSRANEDNGFNGIVKLCLSEDEQAMFIDDTVYFWHYKEDSITRVNNGEYTFNDGFTGYVDNMIYAVESALVVKPENIMMIKDLTLGVIVYLYITYYELLQHVPENKEKAFNACVKFYTRLYKRLLEEDSRKEPGFNLEVSRKLAERTDLISRVVLTDSFYAFINKLKKASKNS